MWTPYKLTRKHTCTSYALTALLVLVCLTTLLVTVTNPPTTYAQTTTEINFPVANLQGSIAYFRSRPDRTSRELADALHRIQSATDGIRADLLALAAATAGAADVTDPIGNIAITSIIPTYERLSDNNDVMVRLAITFNPPSPALEFDRVQVTIEVPEDADVTPADPTGGPLVYGGEFTGLIGAGAYTVNAYLPPPTRTEGWRVYVVSGGPFQLNQLRLSTDPSPSPNSLVSIDPVPAGASASEWTANVTSLTASVEYAVDQVGALVFRLYGTFTPPSDVSYRGVRMVARIDSDTDDIQLGREPYNATAYISTWIAVPVASQVWHVYAQSVGPNSRMNTIVPGTTPHAQVTVEDQAGLGGLDLTRVDSSTFDTSEFEVSGGAFRISELNADKIKTGTLKVGGGASAKPGQVGVFDATDVLIGWIGEQGIWYGAWFKQLWVGGTDPTNAPFHVDAGGHVVLSNVGAYEPSIELAGANFDVLINSTVGVQVSIDGGTYVDTTASLDANGLLIKETASTYPSLIANKQQLYVVHDLITTSLVGAFMDTFGTADAGRIWVSEGVFGNTTVFMDGANAALELRQAASYTPTATYGALQNQSGDPYWYETGGAAWEKRAYFSDIAAGSGHPVVDTTSVVEGSGDGTKEIRFEVDGLTTGTIRVITPPDADITLAGTNLGNLFTGNQTFAGNLLPSGGTRDIGAAGTRWNDIYMDGVLSMDGFNTIDTNRTFIGGGGVNTAGNVEAVDIKATGIYYTDGNQVISSGRAFVGSGGVGTSGSVTATAGFGALLPLVNSYDIGASGDRWDDVWAADADFSGNITMGGRFSGNLNPLTDSFASLGTLTGPYRWIDLHLTGVITMDGVQVVSTGGAFVGAGGVGTSGTVIANAGFGALMPLVNSFDVGASGDRWDEIWAVDLDVTTNVVAGISVIPDTDAGANLGSVAATWTGVYGVTFYGGSGSISGITSTLTCGAGEAVKNLTITGGIVTSASCGTP